MTAEQIPALEMCQFAILANRFGEIAYKTPKPRSMLKAIFFSRFRFRFQIKVMGSRARNMSTKV